MRIAYIDDSPNDIAKIEQYCKRLQAEKNLPLNLTCFCDAMEFLIGYNRNMFDILIMDIEMPAMNGMRLAEKIREKDEKVVIVFLTNVAQYAINGYSVHAVDYILKPVKYFDFSFKIQRAFRFVQGDEGDVYTLHAQGDILPVKVQEILYIEVTGNWLKFHTFTAEYEELGTLKKAEMNLKGQDFFRINYCFLVNMACVNKIEGNTAFVYGHELQISRSRKKAFLDAQLRYWSGERHFL